MKPPEISHFRGLQTLAQFRQRILYFRRHFGIDLTVTSLFASIRQLLEDVARADSLVWDAHKWLFQTYACSTVMFRDRKHLAAFYSSDPEYLRDAAAENGEINYWEWGIELTRPARSLKLWLTLQTLGTDQISDMVTHGIDLAQQTESMLRNQPEWEVVTPTQLAIVKFCYAPQGLTPQQQDELFLGA